MATLDPIALRVWAVACSFLFAKMFFNSLVQAFARVRHSAFVLPEDARTFGDGAAREFELPIVTRASACWRNDLENIPSFLLLSLGYVLLGGAGNWLAVYALTFVVARVLHTGFYLAPRQPHRNLSYLLGVLATLAVMAHALYLCTSG
jgi:uncharacterized MAPEG superfamily protein